MTENELATKVLDAAFEIHRTVGPGLLESAYKMCLEYDLTNYGFSVESEKELSIDYKGLKVERAYRIDLLVNNKLVIEVKAVEALSEKHFAQTLTYLKFGKYKLGLVLNFNEKFLSSGIKRIANNL